MARLHLPQSALEEVTRRIEAARGSPVGEPVVFNDIQLDEIQSVLESGIDFQPQVAEADRGELIQGAIFTAARAGIVDGASLKRHVQQAENGYLRRPIQDYVLATTIGIRYFDQLTRVRMSNAFMTITRELPRSFGRDAFQEQLAHLHLEQPEGWTWIRIRVRTRTIHAAAEHALWSLDLLRGLWNYSINQRIRMSHRWGGRDEPINEIVLGPIHTLHHLNGSLASENFWYESPYSPYGNLYNLRREWDYVKNQSEVIRLRLKKIAYAENLKHLFVQYNRALDLTDYSAAFNKLWSVLERLTSSQSDHEKLIKRVLFLGMSNERPYLRATLDHLRSVRNGFVHEDRTRVETVTYLYQLKWFVERVFHFHLLHGHTFSSLKDVGDFLDLPSSGDVLRQNIAAYQKALKFQTPRNTE